MTNTDIKVMRAHSGAFSWDENELYKEIAKFDMHYTIPYTPGNPQTWPLVQNVVRDNRKNKVLPACVVYSMAYINSQRLITLKKLPYSELFKRYPFNFAPGGEVRKSEGIPYLEFKEWMEAYGNPPISESVAPTTFDKINKALSEINSDSAAKSAGMEARLETMQAELADTKRMLSQAAEANTEKQVAQEEAEKRATEAGQQVTNIKESYERQLGDSERRIKSLVGDCDKLRNSIRSTLTKVEETKFQLTATQSHLAAAQSKLTACEQEAAQKSDQLTTSEQALAKKSDQLAASEQEVATKSEQLAVAKQYHQQQLLHVYAQVKEIEENKKRGSPKDTNLPSAKRVLSEEEMDHKNALARFEEQNCRFDKLREQKNGVLNAQQTEEWKAIWGVEQNRLKEREKMLKKRCATV